MLEKSAHLPIIRQKNTQNTATLPLQTCDKNQWTFLLYDTGVDFSSRNNSANLGSFAKVSFPVQSIFPCLVRPTQLTLLKSIYGRNKLIRVNFVYIWLETVMLLLLFWEAVVIKAVASNGLSINHLLSPV